MKAMKQQHGRRRAAARAPEDESGLYATGDLPASPPPGRDAATDGGTARAAAAEACPDPFTDPVRLPPAAPADFAAGAEPFIASPRPGPLDPPPLVDADAFAASFGEPIARTLDLDTWAAGVDLSGALDRLEAEVARALDAEDGLREQTRQLLFPQLAKTGGGVFQVTREQIEHAQRHVLFNGAVEAADGLCAVHDTLPLTVAQIGVCLTGYGGRQGTWGHRLYRRDLRVAGGDPVQEALAILERRDLRADVSQQGRRDLLSHLFRRGILAWAQRAVLLHRSDRPWRMGHGLPAPYELLTGSGSIDLLGRSLDVLRGLILEHRRFIFVPRESNERLLLTIGNALGPAQFAVVETAERRMAAVLDDWTPIGRYREQVRAFFDDAAPRILAGVYRTFADTPPQVLYAHRDFVQEAATIAMADSLLQGHRNFPALLDLADTVCEGLFGAEGFNSTVQAAYAHRGHPLRYVSERQTKR